MSLRFQRRIRLAPGVRLNLSKSGFGLSVGPRGASASAGRRGVYSNLGLPGTGLSYRQRLDAPGKSASSKGRPGSSVRPSQNGVLQMLNAGQLRLNVQVSDSGDVNLHYLDGTPLSSEEAAIVRKHFGEFLRAEVSGLCDRLNTDLDALGRIDKETPRPTEAPAFQPRPLGIPEPERLPDLKPSFWQRVWPPARRELEKENEHRSEEYLHAFAEWSDRRKRFERQEALRREIETTHIFESVDAMQGVLSDHLGRIPWPKATNIDFDLGQDHHTIAIDIDLPTEDEMPVTQYSMASKQLRVRSKKLSATERRRLYMRYVHGVAFRVLGEVFARLPTVQRALVSAYTQDVNLGTGAPEHVYLYSVIVGRSEWGRIDFSVLERVDPVVALDGFKLRRSMTKTGIFKPIQPLGPEDLERSGDGSET